MGFRARLARWGVAMVASLASLTACGGDQGASRGDPVAGKRVFAQAGCGSCHAFKAADSKGITGPSLDEARPSPGRVLRQLQRPSGLMPSFATKLSETEKRDVAAFVGAGNRSGKAVAAPFRPNNVSLADCGAQDFDCLEQALGNLTFKEGPKTAIGRLQARLASNAIPLAECHKIAHRMGSAALARAGDRVARAFMAGSPLCASGYYHGIVERAFLGQPTNRLGIVARQMCDDPQIEANRFINFQCIHGLGHGLMLYSGYDMPLSLRTCDQLEGDFDQVSCTGGVFMENFNSSYGVQSKYLRANDPIYPCNSVAERHKLYCYLLVTVNILRVTGYDLGRTAAACRRSEPAWVGTCFESFGRDVSGMAGKDAGNALASCRLARRNQGDCLYGVARDIVNTDAHGRRGGRFCGGAPKRHRDRCFSGIGSTLAAIESTPDRLRAACRSVSGAHLDACLRGAGLL